MKQQEHTREVNTRKGKKRVLVNSGVKKNNVAPTSKTRTSLKDALRQFTEKRASGKTSDGNISAKMSLGMAICNQEQSIAKTAYEFREIGDSLAQGKISLDQAKEESRSVILQMEQQMAAVEYAAGRISAELGESVSSNHERIRDLTSDSLGYLIDLEDQNSENSVNDFASSVVAPLYDTSRDAAKNLEQKMAQEISGNFLPEVAENFKDAFQKVEAGDKDSMGDYTEKRQEMFHMAEKMQGLENDLKGSDFHSEQLFFALDQISSMASQRSNEKAFQDLAIAIDSFRSCFE